MESVMTPDTRDRKRRKWILAAVFAAAALIAYAGVIIRIGWFD